LLTHPYNPNKNESQICGYNQSINQSTNQSIQGCVTLQETQEKDLQPLVLAWPHGPLLHPLDLTLPGRIHLCFIGPKLMSEAGYLILPHLEPYFVVNSIRSEGAHIF
jgi:hypothetical protein